MKTRLLSLCILCAVLPGVAAAAGPKITSLDTSGYPTVRATVVTPKPVAAAPKLTENGIPVVGFRAVNLGREKSVAAVIDRSQSMLGQAMKDASAAARAFVGTQARPRPRRHLRGRPPRGPADELLVGDGPKPTPRCARSRSTRSAVPRSTTPSCWRRRHSQPTSTRRGCSCCSRTGRKSRVTQPWSRRSPPPEPPTSRSIRSGSRARASGPLRSSASPRRRAAATRARAGRRT